MRLLPLAVRLLPLAVLLAVAGARPTPALASGAATAGGADDSRPIDLAVRGAVGGTVGPLAVLGDRIYAGAGDRVRVTTHGATDGVLVHLPADFGARVTALTAEPMADGARLWVGTEVGWVHAVRLAPDGAVRSVAAVQVARPPIDPYQLPQVQPIRALGMDGFAVAGGASLTFVQDTGASVEIVSRLSLPHWLTALAVLDPALYVATFDQLLIVDVSDPRRPAIVDRRYVAKDPGNPKERVLDLAVDAQRQTLDILGQVFLGDRGFDTWLAHLDASAPLGPSAIGNVTWWGVQPYAFVLADGGRRGWLHAAHAGGDVRITPLDLAEDGRWRGTDADGALGRGTPIGGVGGMIADGEDVLSPLWGGGFERVSRDAAGGAAVRTDADAVPDPSVAAVDGDRLWIMSQYEPSALWSVDLHAPGLGAAVRWRDDVRQPALAGPIHPEAVLGAEGNRIALANWEHGLSVFDASDPDRPTLRARLTDIRPFALDVHDGRAFVGLADWEADAVQGERDGRLVSTGLKVFDLADPSAPRLDAWLHNVGDVCAIHRDGDVLWLRVQTKGVACHGRGELLAVDVSDPLRPMAIGAPWPDSGGTIVIGAGRLVRSGGAPGVFEVLDVRDPAQPRRVQTLDGVGGIAGLDGSYLFAGHDQTVEVWELGDLDAALTPRLLARRDVPARGEPGPFRADRLLPGGRLVVPTYARGMWRLDALERPVGRAWLPAMWR